MIRWKNQPVRLGYHREIPMVFGKYSLQDKEGTRDLSRENIPKLPEN